MNLGQAAVCVFLILLASLILVVPLLRYVFVGWAAKRKDIMDGLGLKSRVFYFRMFSKSSAPQEVEGALDYFYEFEHLYTNWYGRRFFFTPGAMVLATAATALSSIVFTVLHHFAYLPCNPLIEVPRIAMAAFAGAYMWVVNDFIWRSRRLDFSPADVHWGTLRLAISVPMGYAFAGIAKDRHWIEFVAFGLGAFPLETILSIIRRLLMKSFVLKPTRDESRDDIVKLQGVNREIVERLAKEDITTVAQIAYCDPVRITMRSNLSFNVVIDIMNQALLWMYVQELLEHIRPLGMRGAAEVKHLVDDLDTRGGESLQEAEAQGALEAAQQFAHEMAAHLASLKQRQGSAVDIERAEDALAQGRQREAEARNSLDAARREAEKNRLEAETALADIAGKLGQKVETVKLMFREVAGDPFTQFLIEVWADVQVAQ